MLNNPILFAIAIWLSVEAIYFIVDKIREISDRKKDCDSKK